MEHVAIEAEVEYGVAVRVDGYNAFTHIEVAPQHEVCAVAFAHRGVDFVESIPAAVGHEVGIGTGLGFTVDGSSLGAVFNHSESHV